MVRHHCRALFLLPNLGTSGYLWLRTQPSLADTSNDYHNLTPALPSIHPVLHAAPDLCALLRADINYLDYVWRIIIGFGAIPCVLTIWLRCGPSVALAGIAGRMPCHGKSAHAVIRR